MKIKRAMSLVGFSVLMVGSAVQVGGCAMGQNPAIPDGSSRVPANDPDRVQALQQRVAQDRQLLTENNLLKAQVGVLQQQLIEMTTIVREALVLPPAMPTKPQAAPTPGPVPVVPVVPAVKLLQPLQPSLAVQELQQLPQYAYKTTSMGVVIRSFHPFAKTAFEPSQATAQVLRTSLRGAESIEVRGYTDSHVVNPIDRLIATKRAKKARTWLIENGAEAAVIRTRAFTAGNFLTENHTQQGRALNRRVEIEFRNQQLNGNHVAQSD